MGLVAVLAGALSSAPRLTLALAVICGCAFAAGGLGARMGQPRVIGAIAAGILLGPSLLGALAPRLFHALFPADLFGKLDALASLGVILFVFFVGIEFEGAAARARWRLIARLAGANFVLPLGLGIAIAFPLFSRLGGPTASRGAFVLFLGVAVAITAFPVLAAILDELGLRAGPLGQLALGAAALTDVAAWSLLALAAAEAGSGGRADAAERLLETAGLAAGMLVAGRPLLRRLLVALSPGAVRVVHPLLGVSLAVGLATATSHIGVSVVFGALLAGVSIGPAPGGSSRALERIALLNRGLLLPVFFAATGLRIDLGSSGSAALLAPAALVLAVATLGKLAGVFVAARTGGLPRRDSLALGFLLNTKGLTEIVVLRLGYDLGLLSRDALGVLILVALATTAAAVPALRVLGVVPRGRLRSPAPRAGAGLAALGPLAADPANAAGNERGNR